MPWLCCVVVLSFSSKGIREAEARHIHFVCHFIKMLSSHQCAWLVASKWVLTTMLVLMHTAHPCPSMVHVSIMLLNLCVTLTTRFMKHHFLTCARLFSPPTHCIVLTLALLVHHCCSSLLHCAASSHALVHVWWRAVSERCFCEVRLVPVVWRFRGFTDFNEHELRARKYLLMMLCSHVLFILLRQHACFASEETPCTNTHNKDNR